MSLKSLYEDVPSDAGHYFRNYSIIEFLRGTTAHYDPIFTPMFAAILTSPAIGMGAAAANTIASIGAAIATTSLTPGIITR